MNVYFALNKKQYRKWIKWVGEKLNWGFSIGILFCNKALIFIFNSYGYLSLTLTAASLTILSVKRTFICVYIVLEYLILVDTGVSHTVRSHRRQIVPNFLSRWFIVFCSPHYASFMYLWYIDNIHKNYYKLFLRWKLL